jgi:hypothetical protein
MANTIKKSGSSYENVEISSIDSDFTASDLWSDNDGLVYVDSIQYNPGAASDKCVIVDNQDEKPVIFEVTCADANDNRVKYYPRQQRKPEMTFANGTYSAGSSILITLKEDN